MAVLTEGMVLCAKMHWPWQVVFKINFIFSGVHTKRGIVHMIETDSGNQFLIFAI